MLDLKGYGPSIAEGALLTIEVGLLSLFIAMLLGMAAALAKLSTSKVARARPLEAFDSVSSAERSAGSGAGRASG